jgi:hypothetical protein
VAIVAVVVVVVAGALLVVRQLFFRGHEAWIVQPWNGAVNFRTIHP